MNENTMNENISMLKGILRTGIAIAIICIGAATVAIAMPGAADGYLVGILFTGLAAGTYWGTGASTGPR